MKRFPFSQALIYLGAASVCTLGIAVILGWYLRLPEIIQLHPSFVPMQFNTALGFVLVVWLCLPWGR